MFFPPRYYPPKRPNNPPKGMPVATGIPGLQLNLNVDHMQLLGTIMMMGLVRRPSFKEELEEMIAFIKRMQEAAETISQQMEAVHAEFKRVKTKMAERTQPQNPPKHVGGTYMNPFLHHLFNLMS